MAGSSGTTNSTVTQSNLPAYAKPYYQSLMNRGQQESQQPYQTYDGQRLAGESGATATGLQQMSNYAASGNQGVNTSNAINGQVAGKALGMSGYQAGQITGSNVGTSVFDNNAAQQYMNPYEQNVITGTQQDAVRNAQIEQQQRNLQSAQSGSFGGSRAAVQNQLAANGLQKNLTDIYNTGMSSAYTNAQSQFNTDQSRALNAAQGNQQNSLQAQTANDSAQQAAYNGNLQALGLAGDSAKQFASNQAQTDSSALQKAQAQLGVGQTQENYTQQSLDQSYQDFVNQRDAEKQNLQFYSSLLQGVPVSANSDVQSSSPQNNLSGALSSAGGLAALQALGKTA